MAATRGGATLLSSWDGSHAKLGVRSEQGQTRAGSDGARRLAGGGGCPVARGVEARSETGPGDGARSRSLTAEGARALSPGGPGTAEAQAEQAATGRCLWCPLSPQSHAARGWGPGRPARQREPHWPQVDLTELTTSTTRSANEKKATSYPRREGLGQTRMPVGGHAGVDGRGAGTHRARGVGCPAGPLQLPLLHVAADVSAEAVLLVEGAAPARAAALGRGQARAYGRAALLGPGRPGHGLRV